jgi:glycosyltransferase involved in cell wall biosynthesis
LDAPTWDRTTRDGLRVSRISGGTGERSSLPFVSIILPTIGRSSLQSSIRTMLRYQYPRFELLVISDIQRRGSATARNLGLRLAKGDLVHFAEDDCNYRSSNLRALARTYLSAQRSDHRCAGIVGSFLPAVWGSLPVMIRISISRSRDALKVNVVRGEGRTDYLATGNALCSKQIVMQCGGFNERLSHMFEDLELSLVLRKNGFTLYNCARAVAEHRNEPRLEKYSTHLLKGTAYLRARNAILIHRAWCGNSLNYVIERIRSDVRVSIRHGREAHHPPDINSSRIAEKSPLLDRTSYLLGVIAGLTSGIERQTVKG